VSAVALLVNPDSGTGDAEAVSRLLADAGAEVTVVGFDEPERALTAGAERIVVAGGDGSIGPAAELAGRARVPLAVVPVGTANDFARALGIPQDLERAVALAARGSGTRVLDLGRAGDRPFVNVASAGLSPVAARGAEGLKSRLGSLAYTVAALRAGLTADPISCRVGCDGEELYDGRAWQVVVACGGGFGGGAEVEADPQDGILDVVVIEAGSRAGLVRHAYGMRAGRLESQPGVRTGSAREVDLRAAGGAGFNVDGEVVAADRLALAVRPTAFEVVVG
jgi:YegS/Rv2252/BmrU family lipid kinase